MCNLPQKTNPETLLIHRQEFIAEKKAILNCPVDCVHYRFCLQGTSPLPYDKNRCYKKNE